jgi:hypothetical protein
MEDPETETLVAENTGSTEVPLTVCGIPFRLKRAKLSLFELSKLGAIVVTLEMIVAAALSFMRPSLPMLMRWMPILGTLGVAALYALTCANIVSGGWGADDGRFWCDVKIMYARGFNTIRSMANIWSTAFYLSYAALLLGHASPLTIPLMAFVAAVIEWQTATGENLNQYDIKAFDKFVDAQGVLCLESLHNLQLQKCAQRVYWTPTILSITARLYVFTALLATGTFGTTHTFQIPLVCILVVHICLVPAVNEFAHYKQLFTFCQVEVYRTVADMVNVSILLTLSLV